MNFLKLLTCTVFLLAALSQSVLAQDNDIEIRFTGLYSNTPVEVLSGNGTLGSTLVGNQLYWLCLDASRDAPPGGSIHSYSVSSDSSILDGGPWGTTSGRWGVPLGVNERAGVIAAATNMFYAYRTELLADTGSNEIYNAFQSALWGITFSYGFWGQTGPLSSSVVNEVIRQYQPDFAADPWLETFLNAALITPAEPVTVYFGNPLGDPTLQSIMLFEVSPVPEPSGVVLVGIAGLFGILRRRRIG